MNLNTPGTSTYSIWLGMWGWGSFPGALEVKNPCVSVGDIRDVG